MNRRIGVLVGLVAIAGLAYACGGTGTSDDAGTDSGTDSTTGNDSAADTANGDTGNTDAGTSDTGSDAGMGSDGCVGCSGPNSDCADGGCPSGQVCVTTTAGASNKHQCYARPSCGCSGGTLCACMGSCACGMDSCSNTGIGGGITCLGPVSRREYKTDIDYVSDDERACLAEQALTTHLAEYRYKSEPETAKRHLGFIIDDQPPGSPAVEHDQTHVDLYGYTSMLLATVQEQQKQIDALKTQVDALQKQR
jgi:hypothetical protein